MTEWLRCFQPRIRCYLLSSPTLWVEYFGMWKVSLVMGGSVCTDGHMRLVQDSLVTEVQQGGW